MISMQIRNCKIITNLSLFSSTKGPIFHLLYHSPPNCCCTQLRTYVQVYMKWKKDPFFDSIDSIHKSLELKPIISLKNFFISSSSSPDDGYCIPISDISKKGGNFGINMKVARFLRSYPSFFEEFKGPLYNLPWFRLTRRAIELDNEERSIYEECSEDIAGRLKKLILMSGGKMLPLKIIRSLHWYLGLPGEFLDNPLDYVKNCGCYKIVEIEGEQNLAVLEDYSEEGVRILSTMQKNAMRKGVYNGNPNEAIAFPLFPSKGLRLKQKIKDWLNEFQSLSYVSPYDDYSHLNPDSDLSEKRVAGLLHELLCLFVEHSCERKSLLCLRKHLGLPQKVHKAFERHPYVFYLSLKNGKCTAILKEAYRDNLAIEPHPLTKVRKEYIALMMESKAMLRNKRVGGKSIRCVSEENVGIEDLVRTDEEDLRV